MNLVKMCSEGDLEGVKAALQRGVDVNTMHYGNILESGSLWSEVQYQ